MAPIRVALVGLSSSAKTSWASGAHLPYLLSPTGRAKFQIVALLNSSVEAAKAAISQYKLPAATTRAYGDPADLAADPEVDLVVCNTRVDIHKSTVEASVKAGMAVYVEWPLVSNSEEAEDLVAQARQAGILGKTIIGLQGRLTPLALKVREVIESGRIGKVLSSEVRAFGGVNSRETFTSGLKYFTEKTVGGNIYTIGFTHVFDTIQSVLGELSPTDPSTGKPVRGHFQLQRPVVGITGPDGKVIETTKSDVPDLILVAGTLVDSPTTVKGANFHFRFRRGPAFPGEPSLSWSVYGEKGEIRLVSPNTPFIHIGSDPVPHSFELHDFETNKVENIGFEWEDWLKELPINARNIGKLYEAFADVQQGGSSYYPTWEEAAARHKQLDELIKDWSA